MELDEERINGVRIISNQNRDGFHAWVGLKEPFFGKVDFERYLNDNGLPIDGAEDKSYHSCEVGNLRRCPESYDSKQIN